MRTLNTNYKIWLNMLVVIMLVLLGFILIGYFMDVFRYVFIALLIVYILNPAIKSLGRYGVKKNYALVMVLLGFLIIILGAIYFITPSIKAEISSVSQDWPEVMQRVNQQVFSPVIEDGEVIAYYIPFIDMTFKSGDVRDRLNNLLDQLKSLVANLLPMLLSSLIIVPIITVLLIKDREKLVRKIINFVPNRYFEAVLSMVYDINRSIENFITAKVIQSLLVAGICTTGFFILGVKFPITMGLLAGMFNIVPYIGPLLGAASPVILSYLLLDFRTAALALGVIIIAQIVDNVFTQPVLLPKLVNEHPLIVILVTLMGAQIFGAIGLVLGIAVYSIVKIILTKSYSALDIIYSRQAAEIE
ncbi:AI-2E family transporter [Nanoarchaeota archaeon]